MLDAVIDRLRLDDITLVLHDLGHRQIINDNPGRLNVPQPTTAGAIRQPLSTRAAIRSHQPLRH